jgi:hypothetical protein
MKLKITSLEQTGIAIFRDKEGKEKYIPLFSDNPCEEARGLFARDMEASVLTDVFYTNQMCNYKIETVVKEFVDKHKFLPENYIEEMVSGFPHMGECAQTLIFVMHRR